MLVAPTPAPSIPTLAEHFAAWLPRHALTVRPKTVVLYQYVFDRFLVLPLGAFTLDELTRERILDVFARMATSGRAPNTIQLARAAISACLRDACDARVIAHHPLAGLRMRGRARRVRDTHVYTDEQFGLFLAAAQRTAPRLAPLYLICGRAGLRPGEAQALRTEDFDLTAKTVRVERTALGGGKVGPTKTGGARVVDLAESIVRLVTVHESHADGWCFPDSIRKGPVPYRVVWRTMRHVAEAAGVPYSTPHALRHYAAGAMIQLGLDLLYVSRQLGHQRVDMTASTYARHIRLQRREALNHW